MLQKWRRLRLAVTSVMAVIGLGILTLAWFSIGRVSGEAVANLGFLGVVLPIGFYVVFTLVGWQRSAASGVAPGRFIAFCLRCQLGSFAPLVFMFFLLGLMYNVNNALDRHGAGGAASSDVFDASVIRSACVNRLTSDVQAKGGNPASLQTRIDRYCGCIMNGLQAAYTNRELEDLPSRPNAAQDPQYVQVVQQCQAADKT